MKKLTENQYNALPLGGTGRSTRIYDKIINLKPGEAVIVTKTDWGTLSNAPSRKARYIAKKYKWHFKTNRLEDMSGWVIKRVK